MSIHGAGKQEVLSPLQVSNYMKLCIYYVDFSVPFILRSEWSDEIAKHISVEILPTLRDRDFSIEDFQTIDDNGDTKALYEALDCMPDKETSAYHLTLAEHLKKVMRENKHFIECDVGESLRCNFLNNIQEYFWPNLDYTKFQYGDVRLPQKKIAIDFDERALQLFIESIAFLLKNGQPGLAEILHNSLYFGYLAVLHASETNTPEVVGRMLAPCVLTLPFGLFGKMVPGDPSAEATLVEELIAICLRSEIFQQPFCSVEKFYRYNVDTEELDVAFVNQPVKKTSLRERFLGKKKRPTGKKKSLSDVVESDSDVIESDRDICIVDNPLYGCPNAAALLEKMAKLTIDVGQEGSSSSRLDSPRKCQHPESLTKKTTLQAQEGVERSSSLPRLNLVKLGAAPAIVFDRTYSSARAPARPPRRALGEGSHGASSPTQDKISRRKISPDG